MRQYLNDLTEMPKKCDELDGILVCMSGYDKPKYIDPRNGIAGDLGFDTWIDQKYKPVFNSESSTGTLDNTKYYSILVVPVDRSVVSGADFQRGTPTRYSVPVSPSAAGQTLIFDVPLNEQESTYECGECTTGGTGTLTDSTKAWTVDEWVGYTLKDVETGNTDVITANTATAITTAGLTIIAGDRYSINKSKATARDIYAYEMADEADVTGGTFIYQYTIDDNTTTTYELTSYIAAGDSPPYSNVGPERYAYCVTADNRVFAGGGIEYGTGQASAITAQEVVSATGTVLADAIVITKFTELYAGSNIDKVMKYEFGANITPPTNLYIGSYVSIASTENPAGDISDSIVIDVADDNSWFMIYNTNGVVDAQDNSMVVTIDPNVVVGNGTSFTQGMVGASFTFDGEGSYTIGWVDEVNQKLTFTQLYEGSATTDTDLNISSDYELSWSDYGDPHIWRTENQTDIADDIKSIEVWGGLILVFCSRSLWKIPLNNIYQNPTLVSTNILFSAAFSVVSTPGGVLFYDGSGFSITDGQSIRSITQYKATDLMETINSDMAYNIRGAYDSVNRRVEFVFPTGTDITNNTGMYITIDSLNIYPFTRMDCNVLWEDEDEDGRPVMVHGTSGRHVDSGGGTVYTHPINQATDGDVSGSMFGTITEINAGYMVVDFNDTVTAGEGTYAMSYPPDGEGGYIVQFIAQDIELVSGNTYNVYFSDDWFSSGFEVGGYLYLAMIPFDYGIKWLDFGSPQYQHKVRQLQFDVRNYTGSLIVEHYGDLNSNNPIQVNNETITAADTKIIIPLKRGSYYTYGFRIRGYSSTKFKLLSFEVLFDVEI